MISDVTLKCGMLGVPAFQTQWGRTELKCIQLMVKEQKLPYYVPIPSRLYDTTVVTPLLFNRVEEGVVKSTPKSLSLPCEKIRDLQLFATLKETTPVSQQERHLSLSPEIPEEIDPGQEYHLIVVSDKDSWKIRLVKDPKEIFSLRSKMIENRRVLYCILRRLIIKFPMQPQIALRKAQEIIEEIDDVSLNEVMVKIHGFRALQKTKTLEETREVQKQIDRVALDFIGAEKFGSMIDAAIEYDFSCLDLDVKRQYQQLSAELQKLCFTRSPDPSKEISLLYCWMGPNKLGRVQYDRLDLRFDNAKSRLTTEIDCKPSDGCTLFFKDDIPNVRLTLAEQDIKTLKLMMLCDEAEGSNLKLIAPDKWEWGDVYCLQASVEGAMILPLAEFFDRSKISFLLHDLLIKGFKAKLVGEMTPLQTANFYMFLRNQIQTIPLEKVCQTVETIEDIGEGKNYQITGEESLTKIFPHFYRLIGDQLMNSIIHRGVRIILFNDELKLSKSKSEKLNRKADQFFRFLKEAASGSKKGY